VKIMELRAVNYLHLLARVERLEHEIQIYPQKSNSITQGREQERRHSLTVIEQTPCLKHAEQSHPFSLYGN
jgi:hypothetical protein